MKAYYSIISIFLVFIFSACATVPKEEKAAQEPVTEKKNMRATLEREKKAFDKFNEILVVKRSSRDRKAVLPQMEKLYMQLIDEFPDVPVAQESYWKLIEIYVKDYSPPLYDKAEKLYSRFTKNYPESGLKWLVYKTLALSYYLHKEWNRLLKFSTPGFNEYIEKGESPMPFIIFMYAESNFQLGNFKEAETGFQIVIEKFPQLNEERRAKERIRHIRRSR